jgi:6-phosphogluconolactonase (cycloisomerase 2 family)
VHRSRVTFARVRFNARNCGLRPGVLLLALILVGGGAAHAADRPLGAMTALPGCTKDPTTPTNFTSCPRSLDGLSGAITAVVSPDGRNVYVSAFEDNAITSYSRDAGSGELTPLSGRSACIKDQAMGGPGSCATQALGLGQVLGLAISPDGRNVYGASVDSSAVTAFSRDPKTGALTQLPGAAACIKDVSQPAANPCSQTGNGLAGARWVTVSPDGRNVYATAASGHSLAAFSRNQKTGALTQLPGAAACIEDANDNTANAGLPNGSFHARCVRTAHGLSYPREITVSSDGRNAYVADDFGGAISEFSRDPATGALSQLPGDGACIKDSANAPGYTDCPTSTPNLNGVFSVAVAPDGKNAYSGSDGGDAISAFDRDPRSGALHPMPGPARCISNNDAPESTKCDVTGNGLLGAEMVTISRDGHTVYVAAFHGMAVAAFSRDTGSGALTQLPGGAGCLADRRAEQHTSTRCDATTDGLYQPRMVALSPDGRNGYVPSSVGSTLTAVSLSTSGAPLRFVAPPAADSGGIGVPEEVAIGLLAVLLVAGTGLLGYQRYQRRQRTLRRGSRRWVRR